jgi:hypothetical protein
MPEKNPFLSYAGVTQPKSTTKWLRCKWGVWASDVEAANSI